MSIILSLKAVDFLAQGGFSSQFELIEANLQKLLLEIENLKKELTPDSLDRLSKLSSIVSGISSAVGLFKV